MSQLRFNHMELTVAPGTLGRERETLAGFYKEIFGFDAIEVPLFEQTGLLLCTDPQVSQFILLMEQEQPLDSPGYDHLGFLLDTRAEVDEKLRLCRQWQARDARVQIKEYEDLVVGDVVTHAFYFRYLLPIWFDVQVIEYAAGTEPTHAWLFQRVRADS
jgi:hypothetical protein